MMRISLISFLFVSTFLHVDQAPGVSKTWTGNRSTNWSADSNWVPTGVPGDSDDVTIPSTALNQPVLSADGHAAALTIDAGAMLSISSFTLITHGNVDAGNIAGSSGTVQILGTNITLRGRFPNVSVQGSVSLSGTTVVTGNLAVGDPFVDGGQLDINGDSLTVTGNYSTMGRGYFGGGILVTQNPASVLTVLGNFYCGGSPADGLLTAGTIYAAKDFTVDRNFSASGTLKVVLNGTSTQTIPAFSDGSFLSRFQDLDIATSGTVICNTGSNPVRIYGTFRLRPSASVNGTSSLLVKGPLITQPGSAITVNSVEIDTSMNVGGSFSPAATIFGGTNQTIQPGLGYKNVSVLGSASLSGTTVVNGNLAVGDPFVDGGQLDLNGDSLTVTGNYSTIGRGYFGGGTLVMQNPSCILAVLGNFYCGGSPTDGLLTAGTIYAAKDFTVDRNFSASGTLKVVLNGTSSQTIPAFSGGTIQSRFQDLEIATAGAVTFNTGSNIVEIFGAFRVRPSASLNGTSSLVVKGPFISQTGSSIAVHSVEIDSSMNVGGSFSPEMTIFGGTNQTIQPGLEYKNMSVNGSARFGGTTTINGNLSAVSSSGIADVNGQNVTVTGDYSSVYESYTTGGTLAMKDPAGVLTVLGNAVFDGSPTDTFLTAGTMYVGGNFTLYKNFSASGSHTVVFNGTSPQTIGGSFGLNQHFNNLVFENPAGIVLNGDVLAAGELHSLPGSGPASSGFATSTTQPVDTIRGNGHSLTISGLDVDRLVFDNARLIDNGGTITKFNGVTFQNVSVAATQLTISHPGAPNAFAFENLTFRTTPTTGYYISANDNAADGNILTLNLINSIPHDGSALTSTSGGANVNWGIVANPPPSLAGVSPPIVRRGEHLDVVLTGSNFNDTITSVTLGAGIIVDSLSFPVSSQIMAHISVMDSATIGTRNVFVTNAPPGGGSAMLQNALTVGYPRPRITSITPNVANRTQTLAFTIKGSKFSPSLTSLNLGGNIAVTSAVVNSDTQISVNATVGAIAAAGPRDVVVTNIGPGGGTDTLKNGLTIASPPPQLSGVAPSGAIRGQSGNVLLTGLYFFAGTTSVSFGDSIAVNSVTVNDYAHMSVNISIAPGAAAGARGVTVTNSPPGGGTMTLPNGFTVLRDSLPPAVSNLTRLPNTGDTSHAYVLGVSALDNIFVKSVYLVYSTNNFASGDSIAMSPAGGTSYMGSIPAQHLGTSLEYFAAAYDNDGNRALSPIYGFLVLPIPVFAAISDTGIDEGRTLSFTVHANDANHDPITYSASNLPAGSGFADSTFSWKPGYTQSGNYTVTFTADDHHDGASNIQVKITVHEVDDPPVVQGARSAIVYAGQHVEIPFSIYDQNSGSSLTIDYLDLPPGASVYDPMTTTKYFRWRPSVADTGTYHPKFTVYDGYVADTLTMELAVGLSPGPIIESMSPSYGHCGDMVTVKGFAFGSGTGTMVFNGTPSPATIMGDTLATAQIPCPSQSGDIVLISDGQASNPKYFTVLPQPSVDLEAVSCTVSPLLAADGAPITLTSVIQNHSGYDASAYVTYFGGHPDSGGAALSAPQPIAVAANGRITNSYVWGASPGVYHLYARITGSTPPDPRIANNTIDDGFFIIVPLVGGEMLNVYAQPVGDVRINHGQNYSVSILNSGIDTTEIVSVTSDSIPGFEPASSVPITIRPSQLKTFNFSVTLPSGSPAGEYFPTIHVKTATGNDYTGLTTMTAIEDSPKVTARLVNLDDGTAVPGVLCLVDSLVIGESDAQGEIQIPVEPGETAHLTGVKDGFLPVQTEIADRGDSRTVSVYIRPGQIIVSHVEVQQLTSQQVIDLGLDLNSPANFNYYNFSATIQLSPDQPPITINSPVSVQSDTSVHGVGYDPNFPCKGAGLTQVIRRVVTNLLYPDCPSRYMLEEIKITNGGDTCYVGHQPIIFNETAFLPPDCKAEDQHTEHVPIHMDSYACTKDIVWLCRHAEQGSPGSGGSSVSGSSIEPTPEVKIPYAVIIDGKVRTLKQFFNVTLALANQADPSFTITNLHADLASDSANSGEGPPGPSLTMIKDATPLPDLSGGHSASTSWVIRGDQVGAHTIRISISGKLQPGNVDVATVQYATVIVTEPPQLDVTLHHPGAVMNGETFTLTAEVKNKSTTTNAQLASIEIRVGGTADFASGTNPRQDLGDIPPGQVRFASWTLVSRGDGSIQACGQQGGTDLNFTLTIGGTPCPDLIPSDTTHEDVPPGKVVILGTQVPVPDIIIEVSGTGGDGGAVNSFGVTDERGEYRLNRRIYGTNLSFRIRPTLYDPEDPRPAEVTLIRSIAQNAGSMPTLEYGADNKYEELTALIQKLEDTASTQSDFNAIGEGWKDSERMLKAFLDSAEASGIWNDSLKQTREEFFRLWLAQHMMLESRAEAVTLAPVVTETLTDAFLSMIEIAFQAFKIEEKLVHITEHRLTGGIDPEEFNNNLQENLKTWNSTFLSCLDQARQILVTIAHVVPSGIAEESPDFVEHLAEVKVHKLKEFIMDNALSKVVRNHVAEEFMTDFFLEVYGMRTKGIIDHSLSDARIFPGPDSLEALQRAIENMETIKKVLEEDVKRAEELTESLSFLHEISESVSADLTKALYGLALASATPAAPVSAPVFAIIHTMKHIVEVAKHVFAISAAIPVPIALYRQIPQRLSEGENAAFGLYTPPINAPGVPLAWKNKQPRGKLTCRASGNSPRLMQLEGAFADYQNALRALRALVAVDSVRPVRPFVTHTFLPAERSFSDELSRSYETLKSATFNSFAKSVADADSLFAVYSDSLLQFNFTRWELPMYFTYYATLGEIDGGTTNATYAEAKSGFLSLLDELDSRAGNLDPILQSSLAEYEADGLIPQSALVDSLWLSVDGIDASSIGKSPANILVHARVRNRSASVLSGLVVQLLKQSTPDLSFVSGDSTIAVPPLAPADTTTGSGGSFIANWPLTYAGSLSGGRGLSFSTQLTSDSTGVYTGTEQSAFLLLQPSDADSDAMPDVFEIANGLDPARDDALEDPDHDGLVNLQEYYLGTSPRVTDTDGDGLADGLEVSENSNPLDPNSPAGAPGRAAFMLPNRVVIAPGDTSAIPLRITSGSSLSLVKFRILYDSTFLSFKGFRLADSLSYFRIDSLVSGKNLPPTASGNTSLRIQFSSPIASFAAFNTLAGYISFTAASRESSSTMSIDTSSAAWRLRDQNNVAVTLAAVQNADVFLGTITSVKDDNAGSRIPRKFVLYQNFPNPFNPSTTLRFELPRTANVSIKIYDMLGREVRTLIDENRPAGAFSITWDGRNDRELPVATGVYFCRFHADTFIDTKKLLLIR